ncbi:hypothetical protein AXG93_1154s1010 [Marchantia polymorpha subsp. ruderalis]|uniref:Uncharacterized protein n=1 Tax=Marchantia polymorpha subsp. ruderalis TaxID=1480154 RepID=A0A176WRA5_MARPO|nr:hypothetical protein AXG93_1154s1010 [Marchantia polymorpha subsp. ruderalis]
MSCLEAPIEQHEHKRKHQYNSRTSRSELRFRLRLGKFTRSPDPHRAGKRRIGDENVSSSDQPLSAQHQQQQRSPHGLKAEASPHSMALALVVELASSSMSATPAGTTDLPNCRRPSPTEDREKETDTKRDERGLRREEKKRKEKKRKEKKRKAGVLITNCKLDSYDCPVTTRPPCTALVAEGIDGDKQRGAHCTAPPAKDIADRRRRPEGMQGRQKITHVMQ